MGLFLISFSIIHVITHGLVFHSVVTATKTPRGAGLSTGTEDCRDTIGEFMAVVAKEIVASEVTPVVPGTPLDAIDTQLAVSSWRTFPAPRTSIRSLPMRCNVGFRVT